jgi:hypothetical protein
MAVAAVMDLLDVIREVAPASGPRRAPNGPQQLCKTFDIKELQTVPESVEGPNVGVRRSKRCSDRPLGQHPTEALRFEAAATLPIRIMVMGSAAPARL